ARPLIQLAVAFAELLSGRAEAPGYVPAPWCPTLPTPERSGGSPRLRPGTLVPTLPAASAARCQGSLPAGSRPAAHAFPPANSARSHFSLLTSHFSLLTSHFSRPRSTLYFLRSPLSRSVCPRRRFGTLVPRSACRVNSALPEAFTRGLPPCGSCVAAHAWRLMPASSSRFANALVIASPTS
ncbi:MAG: hypothetical protein RLZZ436_2812, partial [Planctomycetota bacterium]